MEGAQVVNTDVISNLPKEIIDAILIRMPLKDAVRTSILSHRWRHKWVTISQLVFNNLDLGFPHTMPSWIVSIIYQVLLRHQGSIRKFELTALANCYHIDRWMLYLSGKGVKELILAIMGQEAYKVPSYLFQCQELTRLRLSQYFLNPSSTFEGFPCLKSLEFVGVDFGSYSVDKFISKCPVLEGLELFSCLCSCKKINAPNLKFLKVLDCREGFIIENLPLVEYASISLLSADFHVHRNVCDCNHFETLCPLPNIRQFDLRLSCKVPSFVFNFQQLIVLELWKCTFLPPSTFIGFPSLKKLVLSEVNLVNYDLDTLISNCPFLEILELSSFDHSLVKLNAPNINILCIHMLVRRSNFNLLEEGDTAKDSSLSAYNFLQAVSHFPNIVELEVEALYGLRQCASDKVPRSLATTLDFLESLTLPVNWSKTNDVLVCLCLLRSSSNLRKLEIRGIHGHCMRKRLGDDWKADDLYLENLHSVKFTEVVTLEPELEFIKAVVATSPVLVKLTIECCQFVTSEMRFRISKHLYRLKTSSLTQIRIS